MSSSPEWNWYHLGMHLSATSSCPSPVFFLQIFLPSRLDILLPFSEKKDPVWLGLFGQVSLPENSSYNNCCSELDPFAYCSHSFGSGVDPISILLSCAFMYLNTAKSWMNNCACIINTVVMSSRYLDQVHSSVLSPLGHRIQALDRAILKGEDMKLNHCCGCSSTLVSQYIECILVLLDGPQIGRNVLLPHSHCHNCGSDRIQSLEFFLFSYLKTIVILYMGSSWVEKAFVMRNLYIVWAHKWENPSIYFMW